MIKKIEVSGIHYDVDEETKEYALKKIGNLDRFTPKSARKTAHAEIKLFQSPKGKDKLSAEVIMNFKNGQVTAKESASSMFAAIDLVEDKLKNQLTKHHDKHMTHTSDRKGYLRKVMKLADRDFWGRQN